MAHIFIRVEYAFHSLSFFHGIIIVGAEMKKRGRDVGKKNVSSGKSEKWVRRYSSELYRVNALAH